MHGPAGRAAALGHPANEDLFAGTPVRAATSGRVYLVLVGYLLGPPFGRDQNHCCADGETDFEGHRASGVRFAFEPIVQPADVEVKT